MVVVLLVIVGGCSGPYGGGARGEAIGNAVTKTQKIYDDIYLNAMKEPDIERVAQRVEGYASSLVSQGGYVMGNFEVDGDVLTGSGLVPGTGGSSGPMSQFRMLAVCFNFRLDYPSKTLTFEGAECTDQMRIEAKRNDIHFDEELPLPQKIDAPSTP